MTFTVGYNTFHRNEQPPAFGNLTSLSIIKMKNKLQPTILKNIGLATLVLLFLFLFQSCSRKIAFQTSSVVPAAEGTVKVKKDNNNNYHIEVEIINLAEPSRLQPVKKTYVVWMETDQDVAKNIGQVNSSTSFLSKRLKASFDAVSAIKPTRIFITAEDDGTVQYPGMQVLSTGNF